MKKSSCRDALNLHNSKQDFLLYLLIVQHWKEKGFEKEEPDAKNTRVDIQETLMGVQRIELGGPSEVVTNGNVMKAAVAEFISTLIFVFAGEGSAMALSKLSSDASTIPENGRLVCNGEVKDEWKGVVIDALPIPHPLAPECCANGKMENSTWSRSLSARCNLHQISLRISRSAIKDTIPQTKFCAGIRKEERERAISLKLVTVGKETREDITVNVIKWRKKM
eukprot:Gb_40823 [translate_table: standard]